MLAEETLPPQSTGIFARVFTEKIFIPLGDLITDALICSVTYVVENIRSIFTTAGREKRPHVSAFWGI